MKQGYEYLKERIKMLDAEISNWHDIYYYAAERLIQLEGDRKEAKKEYEESLPKPEPSWGKESDWYNNK